MTVRGACGQEQGVLGMILAKGFFCSRKLHLRAAVAREARRCLLSGTQLRPQGYTFLTLQRSCLVQLVTGTKMWITRDKNCFVCTA